MMIAYTLGEITRSAREGDDGLYVLYTDHQAAIAENKAEIEELEKNAIDWAKMAGANQKQINKLAAEIEEKDKRIGDLEESVIHELRRRCQCEFDSGECFSECRYHGKQTDRIAELEDENKRLREALDLVISFIPDGWGMPLGFNQVVAQVKAALAGKEAKDGKENISL